MSLSMEEDADSDVNVVVEEEAHSAGQGDAGLAPCRLYVLRR
jgi:hypothetical protein